MTEQQERALRMCKPKIKYALLSTAQKKAEQSSAKSGEKIEPYKCDICGSYHIGHPKEYDLQAKPVGELILAKVRDPLGNHYIFSLADSGAINGSTEDIYSKGVLVAYKKGKDPFKERGGFRSNHWRIFQALFPRFVLESDTMEFLEVIQTKMQEMGIIGVKDLVAPVIASDLLPEEPKSATGVEKEVSPEDLEGLSLEQILFTFEEMSSPHNGISGDYFKGFVHGVLTRGNN